MQASDRERFGPVVVTLKDGRDVTIRPLSQDDGHRLGDLYEALDDLAARFYWPHPLDREHALRNASRADSPTEVVLVLELPDGALGGYAWYRWKDEHAQSSGFGICVAPACQGCGVGRTLMQRLMDTAQYLGPTLMRLTCQHANAAAVALYRKMGFRIVKEGMVGSRRQWPPEPQYWMERQCR